MLNQKQRIYGHGMPVFSRCRLILITVSALLFAFSQSSCSKKKVAVATPTGIRLALLPFNVPAGDKEMRWIALAGPIMMAKASENARDLEVLPLWESMPIATVLK